MKEFSVCVSELQRNRIRVEGVKETVKSTMQSVSAVDDNLSSIGLASVKQNIDVLVKNLRVHVGVCNALSEGLDKIAQNYLSTEANIGVQKMGIGSSVIDMLDDENSLMKKGQGLPYNFQTSTPWWGGNQNHPLILRESDSEEDKQKYGQLCQLVQDNIDAGYLNLEKDFDKFIEEYAEEGCGYMLCANAMVSTYGPEKVSEMLGIPYDGDIDLFLDKVALDFYCKEDNHSRPSFGIFGYLDFADFYDPEQSGCTQDQLKNRFEHYCSLYGIDVKVETNVPITAENYYEYAKKGEVGIYVTTSDDYIERHEGKGDVASFTITDMEGNEETYNGAHYMTITGLSLPVEHQFLNKETGEYETGSVNKYILSSWGKEYTMFPDEYTGEVNFVVISFE